MVFSACQALMRVTNPVANSSNGIQGITMSRVKILAVADLHGKLDGLPIKGHEIVVMAGDLQPGKMGGTTWYSKWVEKELVPFFASHRDVQFVVVPGNHDSSMMDFIARNKDWPKNVHLLMDDEWSYKGIRFYGFPWCPKGNNGVTAMTPRQLDALARLVPSDIDIFVSHALPWIDGVFDNARSCSPELTAAIARTNPRYVICGHEHNVTHKPQVLPGGVTVVNVSLKAHKEDNDFLYQPYELEIEAAKEDSPMSVETNEFPKVLTKELVKSFVRLPRGSTKPHEGWIDGRHYVLKCGKYSDYSSDAHVHNEFVADEILRAAGCRVPASREYQSDIGNGCVETIRLSEFIENGRTLQEAMDDANTAQKKHLADQVLSTYPVVALIDGTDTYKHPILDNVLVDKDYNLWFIDNGASFDFRARGKEKGWFWTRSDIHDSAHGLMSVWNDADYPFAKLVSGITQEDIRKAAAKYDFASLVKSLPEDYQRKSLLDYAAALDSWAKGGEAIEKKTIEKTVYALTLADCQWLESVSLLIAKAVRRINKFIDEDKISRISNSKTIQFYRSDVDQTRLADLVQKDPTGRASKLLDVCDTIANSEAAGFKVKVLPHLWHRFDPSSQRPNKNGNVDFADYEFTRAAFEAAGGVIV